MPHRRSFRHFLAVTAAALAPLLSRLARAQTRSAADETAASIEVRFQDKDDLFHKSGPRIRAIVDSTVHLVSGVLQLSAVTILIAPDASRSIPGYGVGGYTPNAHLVTISIDPVYADSGRMFVEHLSQTVAHELHHAARDRGPGYGESLLEALVSEGLADHFAVTLLRIPPPPWTHALTAEQGTRLLATARSEFDLPSYDHARWFFGSADLPRWTGYALGYELVSKYLEANPEQTAASLVYTPARTLRP